MHFINLYRFSQEESRSISENVTWGQRKRMADGKVSLPYGQFLGYEKGEDGLPRIVESEAEIVRMIFRLFVEGKTPSAIARQLAEQGIPSPAGKKTWQVATVKSILTNEKFKGDALLQKNKILFEQNYEKVFKGVLIFCRNYHLAEDMTQEAFLKAFRVIHQLKKPEHFSAWVYTIAINLIKKEALPQRQL